ncbi:GroES-like protein [Schizopora paradoxa]|uniref:GroES-like protein n=1 Tax=Schizopora paradoxa TaxID=27342 RepID=A0A0H2R8S9_9AGAM|nr:GroES-like protein [Schizopora paradoxa]
MSTQIAVITSKAGSKIQSVPIPEPGPNEILIKNVAVASNPKDYKLPLVIPNYEFIEGSDVAGYVEKVGEGVTEYKGGERVAAFTKMATKNNKYGGYQQYSVAAASCAFPIPESISFEDASTLPLAIMTAALGLFVHLGLPAPPAQGVVTTTPTQAVIINGASSSVGAYAVQLARRAGLYVIGVAGGSSAYPESLGADVVVDYRSHKGKGALQAALTEAVKKSGLPCDAALDAISAGGTISELAGVVAVTSASGSGKVNYTGMLSDDEKNSLPPTVNTVRTAVFTAYGEHESFSGPFYRQISQYLVKSDTNPKPLLPNKVKLIPGGLAGVEKGLALLKANEVHAEKLVYKIDETPSSV